MKSGFKSSEFFVTAVNSIAGGAIMLGYLTPQQADEFVKAVVATVGGILVVVSTVVYIVGRIRLKQTAAEASTPTVAMPTVNLVDNIDTSEEFVPR